MNCSKRGQASGSVSISSGFGFFGGFAMKTPTLKQLPLVVRLPPRYSTEIGRITVRWAHIEWRLRQLAYRLLDVTPAEGRIAVRDLREADYLDMVCQLLELNNLRTPLGVPQLHTDLVAWGQFRNLVSHGIWVRHPETGELMAQLTRGQWDKSKLPRGRKLSRQILTEAVPVTLSDLQKAVREIHSIGQRLEAFWRQLDKALSRPSLGKSQRPSQLEDRRLDHIARKLQPPPRPSQA
jgi:hypothetical protein